MNSTLEKYTQGKKQRDLLVRKYILALLKEAKTRGKRDPQLVFGKQTNECS